MMRALYASSLMAAMGAGFLFACAVPVRPKAETKVACGEAAPIEIHFSPHHGADVGCTVAVDKMIGDAKRTIRMAAYGLTSEPIAEALIAAKTRGVDVQVTVDKSSEEGRVVAKIAAAGVVVRVDHRHAIAHQKLLVVDGEFIEEGSFNYTTAADARNSELCVLFRSKEKATIFVDNWNEHRDHSEKP